MTECLIEVELFSYWHVGSGSGRGAEADALTRKDDDRLPFLPGRSIKGLLREAVQTAEDFKHVKDQTTRKLFGTESTTGAGGVLKWSDAVLPTTDRNWLLAAGSGHIRQLYRLVSATALNEQGLAVDHSLRAIEVCVPMRLVTRVSCDEVEQWPEVLEVMRSTIGLVRSLGHRRRRGLGRCRLSLVNATEGIHA